MKYPRRRGYWLSCLLLFFFAALLPPALAWESGIQYSSARHSTFGIQNSELRRQKAEIKTPQLQKAEGRTSNSKFKIQRSKFPNSPTPQLSNSPTGHFEDFEAQGRRLYETRRFAEAVRAWQQAVEQAEGKGDGLRRALALSNVSLTQQQLGEWSAAADAITAALVQLGALGDSGHASADQRRVRAQALDIQGKLQFSRGQSEAAIATWQQAAADYRHLSDELGVTRTDINQAQALRSLGHYRQAQSLLVATTQRLQGQPDSLLKALALRSLGNVLRNTGALDASTETLQQSLALSRSLEATQASAETLLSLGHTARVQGDMATALQFYQQAVATTRDPTIQVSAQLHQVSGQIENQQWTTVQQVWPQIVESLTALPSGRTTAYAHIELAQDLITLYPHSSNDTTLYPQAAQLLVNALHQARQLEDPRAEAYSLGRLGYLYEQTQQWADADTLTKEALQIAQTINAADLSYQWQWQRGRLMQRQWVSTRSPNAYQQAITAYEQAIAALQSLRSDLVAVHPGVRFSFRDQVEPVYREFVELLLVDNPDQSSLQKARNTIEALQLAELDNFFREACIAPNQAIDRLVDQQDQHAAVFYAILLADRVEVVLKLPQQPLQHYATPIPKADAETVLQELRRSLLEPDQLLQSKDLAKQVYGWLIQPAMDALDQNAIQRLVFVLDSPLQTIPMAALYDGQHYLVENYSTVLAPGLQLVDPQPLEPNQLQTLAVGLAASRHGFPQLPNVASELDKITKAIPSHILLDQQFTVETLQTEMRSRSFPIVHLATHGQFSSDPSQTFVLAWDRPIQVNELDDFLRARDISRPDPLELLILSACETAAGDKRAALGLAGVAYRAGARSTVASLWTINDASTAEFMGQLYQALIDPSLPRAEALRHAQLSLLQNPQYQRPMFWAPYILLGNWL